MKVYLHESEYMVRQAQKEKKEFKYFMERLSNMRSICLGLHQNWALICL